MSPTRLMTAAALATCLAAPAPAQAPKKDPPKLPDGVQAHRNLSYGPHERHVLDLFVPAGDKPLPLLIWVHGGAWLGGSKDGQNPALQFLTKSYAVASINYRLSQHAVYPAQIEDCKAAVRYLRANAAKYRLNPDRFGAWGASAGGHLVALLGTTGDVKELEGSGGNPGASSRVQAVCDYFGPVDFTTMNSMTVVKGPIDHDSPTAPEAKLIGGPVQENRDKSAKANPVTFITKDDPPFLILHGDKDPLVPHGQSEYLQRELKKAGLDATLIVAAGVGHDGRVGGGENAAKIAAFFDRVLKKD